MKKRFENKNVLITGGNSGIGLATAKAFIQEGAKVVITGRNAETLSSAQKELGPSLLAFRSDVSNHEDLNQLFTQIQSQLGRLDVVFINAGISNSNPIEKVTEEIFDQLVNTNFKAAFFTAQKSIPLMSQGGSLIFNASVLSVLGFPGSNIYSATKAAVRSLARSFSSEFLAQGIRANVVSPGPVDTPIWERNSGVPADQKEKRKLALSEHVPMKRLGTPEDIANAVLFLASNESAFIAGSDLFVDGGMTQI